MVEYDTPQALQDNENSKFTRLLEEYRAEEEAAKNKPPQEEVMQTTTEVSSQQECAQQ